MNISLLRCLILEKEGRLLQFTEAYYNEQWRSRTIFHSSYRQQRHYGRTSICVYQNGRESSSGYKEQLISVRLLNSICGQETFPFSASLFQLENLIFFTHLPDLLFWSNMVPVSFPQTLRGDEGILLSFPLETVLPLFLPLNCFRLYWGI